jgi:hypothetical protein
MPYTVRLITCATIPTVTAHDPSVSVHAHAETAAARAEALDARVVSTFDSLSDDEARELSEFLVEVLALEAEMLALVVRYYAPPERREVFEREFLKRATFGTLRDRLRPLLAEQDFADEVLGRLKELVEVRNAVAHSLPTVTSDEDTVSRVYELPQGKSVPMDDLHPYLVMALKVRERLASIHVP